MTYYHHIIQDIYISYLIYAYEYGCCTLCGIYCSNMAFDVPLYIAAVLYMSYMVNELRNATLMRVDWSWDNAQHKCLWYIWILSSINNCIIILSCVEVNNIWLLVFPDSLLWTILCWNILPVKLDWQITFPTKTFAAWNNTTALTFPWWGHTSFTKAEIVFMSANISRVILWMHPAKRDVVKL